MLNKNFDNSSIFHVQEEASLDELVENKFCKMSKEFQIEEDFSDDTLQLYLYVYKVYIF